MMLQIVGGALVIGGLYLTYRRTKALEKNVEIAIKNTRVAEEGQITERFTRAVEQLGSDKIEVRLGGIYALERIARDSEKDHWTVMEVLTAYVRELAPLNNENAKQAMVPSTDIQAVLTVIGRRKWTENDYLRKGFLDLSNTNLQGANLNSANLYRAYLSNSNLKNAELNHAQLEAAHLDGANLENAKLFRASVKYAEFHNANFKSALLPDLDELAKAQTLHNAILSPKVLEIIKTKYPRLLEPPLLPGFKPSGAPA